ncbi:MAG: hypothetical protein AAGH73_08570 [Pseudomonadota bacterium]
MIVLLLGSGPSALSARAWPRSPWDRVVAINNAWRVRADWDHLVFPRDFPEDRKPAQPTGRLIDETAFVPAQNAHGGFLFGGATMAFTATYWALHALRPRIIAVLGCDMVYPATGQTHFYGQGRPDPLRRDASLRSLEAKSARAQWHAARQGCRLLNLSSGPSRLTYPRATPGDLDAVPVLDASPAAQAEDAEAALGYETPTGFFDHITPDLNALDAIDALWLRTVGHAVDRPAVRSA